MSADFKSDGSKNELDIQNEVQNSSKNMKPLPKFDNPSHTRESEAPKIGYNFKEVRFSEKNLQKYRPEQPNWEF